jgi:hypothetical protein
LIARTLAVGLMSLSLMSLSSMAETTSKKPKRYACASETNTCACISQETCKAMLGRCKNRTMQCVGDMCTCRRARAMPGDTATGVPLDGGSVDGSAGN